MLICRETHARMDARTDAQKTFTLYSGISSCSQGSTYMGFPCYFFVLYINIVYVLNFESECPKCQFLNFSLNTHFFVKYISAAIPTSLCIIFIVVSPAKLFGTSNYPMCNMFLILSLVYIFLSELYLFIIPFSSCVSLS